MNAAGAAEREKENAKSGRRAGKQRGIRHGRELRVNRDERADRVRRGRTVAGGGRDGIRTYPGIRVLHYAEIPESILA